MKKNKVFMLLFASFSFLECSKENETERLEQNRIKLYMKNFILTLSYLLVFTTCQKESPTVTSIQFEKATLSIELGKTLLLEISHTPSNLPHPKYQWTSSNPDIIAISNQGEVTAKNIGNATINVVSENNLHASCSITVIPIDIKKINLDKKELILTVGEECLLTYEIIPKNATDKKINWSSSDNNIATIDNTGKIKAVNSGKSQIKATASNNVFDICNIIVNHINPTNISFIETDKTIEVTDTAYLSITFAPSNTTNKKILWSSSNTNIVTVSTSGEITGIAKGTATIIAKTESGECSTTCKITVTEVKVKSITIEESSLTLSIGETHLIKAIIHPVNAANTNIQWTSSNNSTAFIDSNGYITTKRKGSVTITATTEDGQHAADCNVTVLPINEMITIEANGRHISQLSNGFNVVLNSRIHNPTSIPITISSVMLIDEQRKLLDIYDGNTTLGAYQSKLNIFKELFFNYSAIGDWFFEIISKYKVIYSFKANGYDYTIEKNIIGNNWIPLNEY